MTIPADVMEAAKRAYRNACENKQDITYGHKYDCRVNWKGQFVEVQSESYTYKVDMQLI
jgi:hypothetical protein